MPLQRSPTRESTVPGGHGEQQSPAERSLLSPPPSTSNEPNISSEPSEINSNESRLIRVAKFWHKQPELWFVQLESEFALCHIRSDAVKYHSVMHHLDERALLAVAEMVRNPPATDKYTHLKNLLITRFTDSEEKRIRQLLAGFEGGDKRPTELLRELRQLAGGAISDTVLHSIWLQRLPSSVQAILAVVDNCELNKLAELAEKIMDRDLGRQAAAVTFSSETAPESNSDSPAVLEKILAALEVRCDCSRSRSRSMQRKKNRSRSRSKTPKDEEKTCFYHRKFGVKARRCILPCSMSKHFTQQQEN